MAMVTRNATLALVASSLFIVPISACSTNSATTETTSQSVSSTEVLTTESSTAFDSTRPVLISAQDFELPIIGDGKYAITNPDPDQRVDLHDGLLAEVAERMCLHARSLSIPRPGRKILTVTAPLPKHMGDVFADLGFSEGDAT